MQLKDFKQYCDSYGANLERWPSDAQVPANEFMEQSADASRYFNEAKSFDRLLDGALADDSVSVEFLQAKIQREVRKHPRKPANSWWKYASAACFLLMIGAGFSSLNRSTNVASSLQQGEIEVASNDELEVFSEAFEKWYNFNDMEEL